MAGMALAPAPPWDRSDFDAGFAALDRTSISACLWLSSSSFRNLFFSWSAREAAARRRAISNSNRAAHSHTSELSQPLAASARGVERSRATALRFAPASHRKRAQPNFPFAQARCKGVLPRQSFASTLALHDGKPSSMCFARTSTPSRHTTCSGVAPEALVTEGSRCLGPTKKSMTCTAFPTALSASLLACSAASVSSKAGLVFGKASTLPLLPCCPLDPPAPTADARDEARLEPNKLNLDFPFWLSFTTASSAANFLFLLANAFACFPHAASAAVPMAAAFKASLFACATLSAHPSAAKCSAVCPLESTAFGLPPPLSKAYTQEGCRCAQAASSAVRPLTSGSEATW
mmetsp:Transcript_5885/g.12241  ORF Transcript_5885/g.12241 Transcript_5885/m.12241 type:complete len:348 (+) Transcript_5885:3-1046(+)